MMSGLNSSRTTSIAGRALCAARRWRARGPRVAVRFYADGIVCPLAIGHCGKRVGRNEKGSSWRERTFSSIKLAASGQSPDKFTSPFRVGGGSAVTRRPSCRCLLEGLEFFHASLLKEKRPIVLPLPSTPFNEVVVGFRDAFEEAPFLMDSDSFSGKDRSWSVRSSAPHN
jgi:hypothetical protein